MNAHLHPILADWCSAFSGDTLRAAANAPQLRAYMVQFVRGGVVERQFEAMAEDGCAAVIQHMDIANGAAVKAMPLSKWREIHPGACISITQRGSHG